MYPISKHRDAVQSGTGVFYQAIPAVGADGKKIMKLIPVQLVNGQSVQYDPSKPSLDSSKQKAVNISSPPALMKKIVTQNGSFVNVLPKRGGLDPGDSLNKHPQQQQTESLMSKVPTTPTPAANCVTSVRLPCQVPVMLKSPALPRGQFLQIPPNAHVRTLPASELPPDIKKQIFNSSASSTPGSGVPSVVFVSPVTTVSQCAAPPCDSGPHSPRLPSQTEATAKTSKPLLKLIPKASQASNGPTRWVIEEEDTPTAPRVHPLNPHSVNSHILRTVAQREKTGKHSDVSESNLDESAPEQDNALIMCNGKVFFVAKKCSLLFKQGENDSPTAATKSSEIKETTKPSLAQTQQDISIIISDESDEVIDLCDDDTQDDSQQAASVSTSAASHPDDDNVIFVSYMPPKSKAESTCDLTIKTQTILEKDRDPLSTGSLDSLTQEKSSGGRADADGRDVGATLTEGRSGTDEIVRHVCASAGTNVHDDEGSNVDSKQSTSTQQVSMGVDVDPESPADGSSAACFHKQEKTPPQPTVCQTSSPAPPPCKMADRQLSQMFGITADVKICLQRIDEASAGLAARSSEFIISAEDRHEPANRLIEKELFLQDFYRSCKYQNNDLKRVEVVTEQVQPAEAATAHTDVMSLQCAVFKLNTKPHSELGHCSPKGVSCGVENTTLIGYVEPIDEDFFNANEIAESQDVAALQQTQTCVDLNTSRIGRTRKRTMCPCCVPGTLEPAVKSSARSEELEKWACRTEHISKKGTRTKAARKGVTTSGNGCLTVRNNQKSKTHAVPARDRLSSTSTDTDELKRDRQIQRLKELLKEREAALELMEQSMS
ncbi:ligand-dependent nuclear receptor-interacting factor 1 isoform X1 [Paralichthys olivaceus]|uniref:ligand-dependent nuclear receptor-interacting factor 1 isoform X1 n=1 Tax=Paralichthys olivaceus TaxID=8255 RepID=UPI00375351C7